LTSIHFTDEKNGIAVGGNTWKRGIKLSTSDGGINWSRDSLYDKQLFALCKSTSQNEFFASGIDQRLYQFSFQLTQIFKFGEYAFYRGMTALKQNKIILVGGESFGTGYMHQLDPLTLTYSNLLSLPRELDAIVSFDSLRMIVAGWGILLSSDDGGQSWDSTILHEHWRDLHAFDQESAVAAGINGSIIMTRDAGKNWTHLRKGNSIFVKDLPLRSIAFKNHLDGMAAGENGIVIKTRDGGKSWIELEDLPRINYLDIFIQSGSYWLCGSEGVIIRIEE